MDIRVSCDIIEGMKKRLNSQSLTIEEFSHCRDQVQQLWSRSAWTYGIVTGVSFLNIIGIAIVMYLIDLSSILLLLVPWTKEIVFFGLVSYEAMVCNELSDSLTLQLSCGTSPWKAKNLELERLGILLDQMNNPISFDIAGVRMTRQKVIVQVVGFSISFIVALIKQLV